MIWEELKNYSKTSECGTHKYVTALEWNALAKGIVLIGLNPSTNDSIHSKTVKKLVNILESNGYGSLCLLNIFSYRSSDPSALGKVEDNITDEDNEKAIKKVLSIPNVDIALMYGNNAIKIDKDRVDWLFNVLPVGRDVLCFGKTKSGQPKHPLMLSNKTKLINYGWK